MSRHTLFVLAALTLSGAAGCADRTFDSLWTETQADADAKKAKAAAAEKAKESKPIDISKWTETKGTDGRIYVTATPEALKKVQAGTKLSNHKSAFGYGPNRETVIFEEDKDGKLADALMKVYDAKHGLKK